MSLERKRPIPIHTPPGRHAQLCGNIYIYWLSTADNVVTKDGLGLWIDTSPAIISWEARATLKPLYSARPITSGRMERGAPSATPILILKVWKIRVGG